jgi:hypothetical protein
MTVEINQKKLYYNYYTSGKFLTLNFKFQVKSSNTPPLPLPQLQMLRYDPACKTCNYRPCGRNDEIILLFPVFMSSYQNPRLPLYHAKQLI